MYSLPLSLMSVVALSSLSTSAAAAEPAGAEAGVAASSVAGPSAGASAKPTAASEQPSGEPWMKRHRPTRNQMEAGIYGGILAPSKNHELYNPDDPAVTWQRYKKVAPDIGLRFGYYPLSFMGLELEGGIAPTKAADGSGAVIGMFRGYGIFQLPYRVAPFALIGLGLLGTTGLGKDVDPALHLGGGVKFYVNDLIALRLDVRDNVATKVGPASGRTNHLEVLLGLSIVLNRKKPVDPDTDGDGFKDRVDACPKVPGVAPDGCPVKKEDPDTDGDGFRDSKDACVDVPGIAPDGCPAPDRDGDGIPDATDQCPDVPETKNNYQDEDGCPDEVPKEVKRFTGVIEGIFFDTDQATIKPASKPTLDNATKVLKDYPEVKVEISGHTDTDGDRAHNVDLSLRRADAVKQYLLDAGIDAGRITTRGVGPDEPIADNTTAEGKAKNRRIQFALIQ